VDEKMSEQRKKLAREIAKLATSAVFGSLSETYRTCGNAGCRCHGPGPKHGPHLNVVYRGATGKSTGYYVPTAAQERIRSGVAAWKELQDLLRDLADLNKDEILSSARAAKQPDDVEARKSTKPRRRARPTAEPGA
jgi:hypothetical protein